MKMEELCKNLLNRFQEEENPEIIISVERNKFIIGLQLSDKVIVETLPCSTILEGLTVVSDFLNREVIK